MKSLSVLICLVVFLFSVGVADAHKLEAGEERQEKRNCVDSLNKNLFGVNVFPIFGVLGGANLPSMKMFVQYKRQYDKMNFRASVNYLSFNKKSDFVDLLKINHGAGDSLSVDYRKSYYNIFSYDIRSGVEASVKSSSYRLSFGCGLIAGYHSVNESYSHITVPYKEFPITYTSSYTRDEALIGFRQTCFFKSGLDFTIGTDICLSENTVLTVQYAPELLYYHNLKSRRNDPDNYFKNKKLANGVVFVPDYLDIIISVRF